MLSRKMFRDIRFNLSQFITIFLMVMIGVMVYCGIESYMGGMTSAADKFYSENNLQDLNVMGTDFKFSDLDRVKGINNVTNAERKLVCEFKNKDNENQSFLTNFIESNDIAKFYVVEGEGFDYNKKGVWVEEFFATTNNYHVGDVLKLEYEGNVIEEKILGLINMPDHLYDVKDESELIPNREKFGFIYLSSKEFPIEYVPFNTIMVDVNDKSNVNQVKNDIEGILSNDLGVVKIEDSLSYSMYESEIQEGEAYVGIFSGIFLFIAVLSVITTMTRVISKQKVQIGVLKALGFKKWRIILHYIGYGFWISLIAAICGIVAGRYFIGTIFMNLQMSFFEVPNGVPVIVPSTYLVALLVVIGITLVTYITCRKELVKAPSESLRTEMPKVKSKNLNITSKGIFKKMSFSTKWNLRDIIRNKFRTITGILGVVGCCMMLVCAFGMLDTMNNFVKVQFEDLYNFDYKLVLKDNLSSDDVKVLTDKYGSDSSCTIGIELESKSFDDNNNVIKKQNSIFVTDANTNNSIRFMNDEKEFINIDSNEGVYITSKLALNEGYNIGDTLKWTIYGDDKVYETKIIGFNSDPQNQNITMTREYLDKLGINYIPDSIYTNMDLSDVKEITNVQNVSDKDSLKENIMTLLDSMRQMICLIIVFAILLGVVILYNMGVLSYSEKQYQFATLKVLGFKNKKIEKIFIKQNSWITFISILIGLPTGYYLTDWLFKNVIADTFDIGVHINLATYVIATIGTFVTSYIVSKVLARKIKKIDMVSSLKGNE